MTQQGYGPYSPPIRETVTWCRKQTSTTDATSGSAKVLNDATLAAGEVTSGPAVTSATLGSVRTRQAADAVTVLDRPLAWSDACGTARRKADSAMQTPPTWRIAPLYVGRSLGVLVDIDGQYTANAAAEKTDPSRRRKTPSGATKIHESSTFAASHYPRTRRRAMPMLQSPASDPNKLKIIPNPQIRPAGR